MVYLKFPSLVGKSVKCGARETVRVFPYDEETPTGPKRSHDRTVDHGKEAAALQNPEKNVWATV